MRCVPLRARLLPLLQAALGTTALADRCPPVVVDLGIRWLLVRLETAADCMALAPEVQAFIELERNNEVDGVAVFGPHAPGGPADYEVRALLTEHGMLFEDPVTGSANACIARLLQTGGDAQGVQPGQPYHARQGTALDRAGRVAVTRRDGQPWIGGQVVTVVDGTLRN